MVWTDGKTSFLTLNKEKMENFFIDNEFYDDLCSYMESRELEEDNIPDDWSELAVYGDLQPMYKFDLDWIFDRLNEERDDEEGNGGGALIKIFNDNINFDAINEAMPKFWYATKNKFVITKQDLLDYCN